MTTKTIMTTGNQRGFSLLELMLVLAIIGAMTAAAAWALSGQGTRAKRRVTWTSMNLINSAIGQYNLDHSSYPAALEALQAGPTPYLEPSKPLQDAWQEKFLYSPQGTNGRPYDLVSKGADKKFPSPDDLNIWDPRSGVE